jgi:hypothetical protein
MMIRDMATRSDVAASECRLHNREEGTQGDLLQQINMQEDSKFLLQFLL